MTHSSITQGVSVGCQFCIEADTAERSGVHLAQSLTTLVHNLAIGGALCRAFDLGQRFEEPFPLGEGDSYPPWHPGCGKPVGSDPFLDEPLGCCPRHTWGDEFHDPGCTGAKP